ncbi:lytic transglycosylase domain-containing protein [Massilia sp. CT11-137]|uniref:lytic transglycosylase domain-containing protein n=1 Tax=Massilia sp. CT11-137 TaxID=3393901 RepID=UPI0039A606D4
MARQLIAAMLALAAASVRADCFDRAAARFGHNADLLRAMAEQESGNRADALGPVLADGNRALGKMQVNSVHLPELARYGVTRRDLMTDCGSVFVGAWIFARYVALVGPTWRAVGIYNTGPASDNHAAQARYIAAVRRRFERLQRAHAMAVRGNE